GPVEIFEREDERRLVGEPREQLGDHLVGAPLQRLGRELGGLGCRVVLEREVEKSAEIRIDVIRSGRAEMLLEPAAQADAHAELAGPPDELGLDTGDAPLPTTTGTRTDDGPGVDRAGDALQLELERLAPGEERADGAPRCPVDEHGAGCRGALEARGEIDGLP